MTGGLGIISYKGRHGVLPRPAPQGRKIFCGKAKPFPKRLFCVLWGATVMQRRYVVDFLLMDPFCIQRLRCSLSRERHRRKPSPSDLYNSVIKAGLFNLSHMASSSRVITRGRVYIYPTERMSSAASPFAD